MFEEIMRKKISRMLDDEEDEEKEWENEFLGD